MPVTESDVKNVLSHVLDPEIQMSVIDLGLIYGAIIKPLDDGQVHVTVKMTLTTPACPYGPALLGKVYGEVKKMTGVKEVEVDLVWVPPWDPKTMASDEAKMQMGFFDFDEEPQPPR